MVPLFFSCEHATCAIPEAWRDLFRGSEDVVVSPEGWEPGALNLAQGFAMKFRTPLVHGDVTRLLIDLDATGDARWSRFSSQLTDVQRGKLVERHETKLHDQLVAQITEALRRSPSVVHVLVHTSPEDDGTVVLETQTGDANANRCAAAWEKLVREADEPLRVESRLTTSLPASAASLKLFFGPAAYSAVVLRVSQSFFLENRPWRWEKLKKHLIESLMTAAKELTVSQESPSSPGY